MEKSFERRDKHNYYLDIAETVLENPVLVNNVRGVQGYTGTYKGVKVSVMASGMGMPSIGIYSFELYNFFGVENIMRIGSAGTLRSDINLRDIVMGMGACTNSNFAINFGMPGTFAPICDYTMLKTCADIAEELKLPYHVGNILSSDMFYNDDPSEYVKAALSPAAVKRVDMVDERTASVVVAPDQLSLAIGKMGQNARLAAKLTGYKIDIKSE